MTGNRQIQAVNSALSVKTPEGAQSLRQLACSAAWRVDAADLPNWITPQVRENLPAALREAEAWLVPSGGDDFMRHLVPTLALVAPVGMNEAEKTAWFASAGAELSSVPADLLAIGCDAVRKTCDHPSKIIAGIWAAISTRLAERRSELAKVQRIMKVVNGQHERKPWEPEPWDESMRCTPEQANAISRQYGFSDQTPERVEKPLPTVDDYMALGLSRAVAESMLAEQIRKMDRDAKPIGKAA